MGPVSYHCLNSCSQVSYRTRVNSLVKLKYRNDVTRCRFFFEVFNVKVFREKQKSKVSFVPILEVGSTDWSFP
jgi:hypothetical protein